MVTSALRIVAIVALTAVPVLLPGSIVTGVIAMTGAPPLAVAAAGGSVPGVPGGGTLPGGNWSAEAAGAPPLSVSSPNNALSMSEQPASPRPAASANALKRRDLVLGSAASMPHICRSPPNRSSLPQRRRPVLSSPLAQIQTITRVWCAVLNSGRDRDKGAWGCFLMRFLWAAEGLGPTCAAEPQREHRLPLASPLHRFCALNCTRSSAG